ncbi:uncharacterized protein L201_004566 [Kwoniella dendrophila CBS 6074]|uniref:DSBA-like thioredoxin domain-containing protein n=1 Tax=Kwoniella dendrophila CBS 6074 TaxID=1295534 RepID=A0AAX4JW71_9TREE
MSSHKLALAIQQFKAENPSTQFQIRVQLYLLDPDVSAEPILVAKNSTARFRVERWESLKKFETEKFAAIGLKANNEGYTSSTVPAHRLLAYANTTNVDVQWPLALDLMKAHHLDGRYPADPTLLFNLAVKHKVFTDEKEVKELLSTKQYVAEVRQASQEAKSGGIKSVPFYRFQGVHDSPNSKTADEFIELFKQYSS